MAHTNSRSNTNSISCSDPAESKRHMHTSSFLQDLKCTWRLAIRISVIRIFVVVALQPKSRRVVNS